MIHDVPYILLFSYKIILALHALLTMATIKLDAKRSLLAHGYIRKYIQSFLDANVTIPLSIIELCKDFFALFEWINFEIYDKSAYEVIMNKERSSMILKSKDESGPSHWQTICAKDGFSEGIHCWKLKCIKYGGKYSDALAIVEKTAIDIWPNTRGMGQAYYLFNGFFFDIKDGGRTNQSLNAIELWQDDDELIMTLDFEQSTYSVLRQRKDTKDIKWSIKIDNTKTYHPSLGMSESSGKYQLFLM